jgi:hypothetical protein
MHAFCVIMSVYGVCAQDCSTVCDMLVWEMCPCEHGEYACFCIHRHVCTGVSMKHVCMCV